MLDKLKKLEQDGYLRSQTHNTLPLTIWNYSAKCQWEEYWNDITLQCRGLVTDGQGNIVNNPLKKFFNYGETRGKYDCDFKRPFVATQKMDGSLIQVFLYQNQLVVTSRGSFHSDQATWAMDIIANKYSSWREGITYVFELIHPKNRIVLDYGDTEDLILLAARTLDGKDLDIWQDFSEFTCVEKVELDIKKYKDLNKLLIPDNEEGYVILFKNGNRVKIKGEEYCRLHKIVTNISSKDIWQSLKNGEDMLDIAENVPDEWLQWYFSVIGKIYVQFDKIEREIMSQWNGRLHANTELTKKQFAHHIRDSKYKGELFLIWDGKPYEDLIWDRVRPEYEVGFSAF